nr:retrovirus-related Pol polyprotein from transposon TNT 1-94 [Tanacetum cinerariifolium]
AKVGGSPIYKTKRKLGKGEFGWVYVGRRVTGVSGRTALRFETYVKAKDLDLWHIILNGDFPPFAKNKVTQILEVVPFEEKSDDLKKKLAKNNEAKMVLYNTLPKKEYERIFMCKMAKDIWQSLLITHQYIWQSLLITQQCNSQLKDNKIDLLVQQYEQFTILEEESINSGFARFNTIITSLKALDEGFSRKNYVRKFLRALHPKWRAKVMAIEESKDLNFKKFFRRKGKFVRQPIEEKKSLRQRGEKRGKSDQKCFRCGDLSLLIGDCPKTSRNKYQKAFIGGSLSDSENDAEDKTNDETCLMAQSSNEVCLRTCLEPDEWIKDSGCSKHMTGNKSLFSTYKAYDEGNEVFESNLKGKIIGKVPLLLSQSVIGTKWVFRNKLDETGIVSRNKARLVAQGYNQQEGIEYDETYALVARLESIRILLAIACTNDFKLYQMDVKSAFLNGFINEEVYVAQPSGFIDFQKPNYVYKLKKVLYGLKQTPKAWYDRRKAFLIKHEYSMGMVDNILFTKKSKSHLIIVQIYVDKIIFGSMSQNLCDNFTKIMHDEFEMSMMGELNFFLGLQIKQMEDGIFLNQSKYIKEMLKKFGLEDSKPTKTLMSTKIKLTKDDEADSTTHLEAIERIFSYIRETSHLGLWYPKGTRIETIVYADSDHAGDYVNRKSTSGVCKFMGCCLTSWFTKKQTALAISMTEAEYVSTGKACQQALWMKHDLIDYGIRLDNVPIMCENKGAIDLSKNPVQHSRTKHLEIRHHFLCDNIQKGNISIEKVAFEDNIADVFTKPLKRKVFNYLRLGLGMIELIMDSDPSSSQR